MTIILLETASENIRGLLRLWLIEPKPGVFVGKISSRVREFLWNEIRNNQSRFNGAILIYSYRNETGFMMEMIGTPVRKIVDMDGLQLIKVKNDRSCDYNEYPFGECD